MIKAQKSEASESPLSEICQAIVLGSLLGDGSLKVHIPYKNARFSFRHSVKQKEYFHWKAAQLSEISAKRSIWIQGTDERPDGWGTQKLRYQSAARTSLTALFELTHPHNHFQVRRRWLNKLTPLSLAIWWLDDGSLVADSRQGVLCTDGFSREEVLCLQQYLQKVWHITTKLGQVVATGRYRLWIRSSADLQTFLRIILPYIPVASMLPKVILLFRDSELQQRWISEVILLSQFPAQVVRSAYNQKRSR